MIVVTQHFARKPVLPNPRRPDEEPLGHSIGKVLSFDCPVVGGILDGELDIVQLNLVLTKQYEISPVMLEIEKVGEPHWPDTYLPGGGDDEAVARSQLSRRPEKVSRDLDLVLGPIAPAPIQICHLG